MIEDFEDRLAGRALGQATIGNPDRRLAEAPKARELETRRVQAVAPFHLGGRLVAAGEFAFVDELLARDLVARGRATFTTPTN